MNIVFTGASSFTGYWFIKELFERGYQVVAPLKRKEENYTGIRLERVKRLKKYAEVYEECTFGSEKFFNLIKKKKIDYFCHHAADVENYKSKDFDVLKAVQNNVGTVQKLFDLLKEQKIKKFIITGSVFEPNEGKSDESLKAVSPYGLSKGITSQIFSFYAEKNEISFSKYVIPNPFGLFEEFRFTSLLAKTWLEGKKAFVTHPFYIRDNVPVDLLAKDYALFLEEKETKKNPSFFVGSQKEFTRKFSKEMQKRFQMPCEFEMANSQEFLEPKMRVNTEKMDPKTLGWKEDLFWDELADFYQRAYAKSTA